MSFDNGDSIPSADVEALKERVAEACRVLGGLDLTACTYGHISARLPGTDRIFVRARGPSETGVRYTAADDIIEIDLSGRRICGGEDDGYDPPLEVFIHTEIYKRRSDVYSVVHSHLAAAVSLTITGTPIEPIYGAFDPHSLLLALKGVPVFEKSILINNPALGSELAGFMGDRDVCLMHGHGVTTAANSPEEATLLAIHLNTIATMTQQAKQIGEPKPIPKQEQDYFLALSANSDAEYSEAKVGKPTGRAASLWRYYTRRIDDRGGEPS